VILKLATLCCQVHVALVGEDLPGHYGLLGRQRAIVRVPINKGSHFAAAGAPKRGSNVFGQLEINLGHSDDVSPPEAACQGRTERPDV
jgi:hypothetical protein